MTDDKIINFEAALERHAIEATRAFSRPFFVGFELVAIERQRSPLSPRNA